MYIFRRVHKTLVCLTEVRLHSRGNMLARIFELKDSPLHFFETNKLKELKNSFPDVIFI